MMATALQLSGFSAAQIALIKRTVAKDTNDDEFNLFMEACRRYGLDPFRKQISAIVFNKNKADKRQLAIIVNRDGQRVIAQRCGNYRPASEPAEIEHAEGLIGPTNPKGIVKAVVRLWQQDNRGSWFPVVGEAYWDEFAPVKEEWTENRETQRREPSGKFYLDGKWPQMPALMLTKCAEAQALRAGWPSEFGGIYAEEEVEKAQAEMTASELLAEAAEADRLARIGGRGILFSFDPSGVLENVPQGGAADRCLEFIRDNDAETVYRWSIQNRVALQQFWAAAPSDALAVKAAQEAKVAAMTKAEPAPETLMRY
jgi:phage recombination protein Bet